MQIRIIKYLILATLFIFCAAPALSQMEGFGKEKSPFSFGSSEKGASIESLLNAEQTPVGARVDPDLYRVGPGDLLSIQIHPMIPLETILAVSPQNTVMIPRLGEFDLDGLTINEAKMLIDKKVKERNPQAEFFLALRQARLVLVTISGNVLNPGTYTLPASYNISAALKVANKIQNKASSSSLKEQRAEESFEIVKDYEKKYSGSGISAEKKYSTRNIICLHQDGTSETADLEKAEALAMPKFNPYLREGDDIIVPFEPKTYPIVSISGAVLNPCVIEYKRGDKVSFLIRLARGFKGDADPDAITLIDANGVKTKLSVDENMRLIGDDYPLEPGSVVIVGEKPAIDLKRRGAASIQGGVKYPGVYPVVPGETKLKQIVESAGGFTDKAYLPLAYIIRRGSENPLSMDTKRDILEYFQYSDLTVYDTLRYKLDMTLKEPIVSCDFVEAFENGSEKDNVPLEDGDIIVIPANPKRVFVFGQVVNPGFIEFVEGQNMQWYIDRAGGFAPGADKDRARIIRGRTKVWLEGAETALVYAGDLIYAPRPPETPPELELQTWSMLLGIISATATLLNLVFYIIRTS